VSGGAWVPMPPSPPQPARMSPAGKVALGCILGLAGLVVLVLAFVGCLALIGVAVFGGS